MERSLVRRYIAVETATSVAINTVMSLAAAALFGGQEAAPAAIVHGLRFEAVLQIFMSAFMTALVPSLLTHRRQLTGRIRTAPGADRLPVLWIALVALLLATSVTALGLILVSKLLPHLLGNSQPSVPCCSSTVYSVVLLPCS